MDSQRFIMTFPRKFERNPKKISYEFFSLKSVTRKISSHCKLLNTNELFSSIQLRINLLNERRPTNASAFLWAQVDFGGHQNDGRIGAVMPEFGYPFAFDVLERRHAVHGVAAQEHIRLSKKCPTELSKSQETLDSPENPESSRVINYKPRFNLMRCF